MILPTKHVTPAQSLLGTASRILECLNQPRSINELWEDARLVRGVGSFDRFVLALDLLFIMGGVEIDGGMVRVSR